MVYRIAIFILMLTFVSCSAPIPDENQIVGIWKGKERAIIHLNPNHTAQIINYPLNLNNSSFTGLINGSGSWKLTKSKSDHWWSLEILIKSDRQIKELQSNNIAIELLISRTGLIGTGSEVKSLFTFIGDPDSNVRYEFNK